MPWDVIFAFCFVLKVSGSYGKSALVFLQKWFNTSVEVFYPFSEHKKVGRRKCYPLPVIYYLTSIYYQISTICYLLSTIYFLPPTVSVPVHTIHDFLLVILHYIISDCSLFIDHVTWLLDSWTQRKAKAPTAMVRQQVSDCDITTLS